MKDIETAKQVISTPILENPPSGPPPPGKLTPRDAETLAEALVAYHGDYAALSKRRAQREWAECYVHGPLSDLERKTVEPMVLALKGPDPAAVRAVQPLLGEGTWDDAARRERRERLVAHAIGQADGVLICDGRGLPKPGAYSVGVARQSCGAVGQIANGHHGVFVAYASSRG
jgi:SRSO17 transposase